MDATSVVGSELRPYLLAGKPVAGGERMAVTFPYDGTRSSPDR